MSNRKVDVNPFNSIVSILILVGIFVGLYFLATGIFKILTWLTPVLLIATLIIDHRVVVNFGKWLVNTLRTNFILGLGAVLLMIFGYPIIAGYLFTKALVSRKLKQVKADFEQRTQPQYAEYEEVEPTNTPYEDLSDEKPLDLNAPRPPRPKEKPSGSETEYDQLFE